jgi:hypothetical protein
MLEGYLAFARGDTSESATSTDIGALLEDVRADAERHGAEVVLETHGDLDIRVRPMAIKRCVGGRRGALVDPPLDEPTARSVRLRACRADNWANGTAACRTTIYPPPCLPRALDWYLGHCHRPAGSR